MLMIVRAGPLPDDDEVDREFMEALKMTREYIRDNSLSRFYFKYLPPRVPFVGGPPVSPQGITCSRPSTV